MEAGIVLHPGHAHDMSTGYVADMHVVSDAGAIGCDIVIAIDVELLASELALHDACYDVRGTWFLPQISLGISTHSVEVAECHGIYPICGAVITQYHLAHELAATIGINWVQYAVLSGSILPISVHCAAAAEDEIVDLVLAHVIQQREHACHVSSIVASGICDAWSNQAGSSTVYNCSRLPPGQLMQCFAAVIAGMDHSISPLVRVR